MQVLFGQQHTKQNLYFLVQNSLKVKTISWIFADSHPFVQVWPVKGLFWLVGHMFDNPGLNELNNVLDAVCAEYFYMHWQ